MDHTAFGDNLKKHLNLSEDQSLEDMISTYNSILTQTLDTLAPVKTLLKLCKYNLGSVQPSRRKLGFEG